MFYNGYSQLTDKQTYMMEFQIYVSRAHFTLVKYM